MRVHCFKYLEEEDFSNPLFQHSLQESRVPSVGELVLIKQIRWEVKQIFTDFDRRVIQVYIS